MSTLNTRKIKHDSSSVDNITLDANGRVGIGTSLPATPLDVTKANGGNFVATFQNTSSSTPYGVFIKDAPSGANGYPLLQVTNSAGAHYFRVDSGTGYVTKPYQPAFYAVISSGYTISSGQTGVLTFNNVIFNVGNHYNSSTSTFTAPISGRYMFITSVGSTGGMASSSYLGIAFRVNGTTQNAQWQNSPSGYQVQKHMQIFNLVANDTVTVWCEVSTSFTAQNPFFQGILLG